MQGAFGAILAPAALSLLTTTFTEPKERAKAFGVFSALAGAGSAIGLILGGVITNYLTWRWTMYVNVIIAVVAVVGAVLIVTDRAPRRSVKVDYLGTLLGCGGLLALVYGFTKAASDGWSDSMTLILFAIALVALVGFGFWQNRTPAPLLPPHIVTDRNRAGSFVLMALAAIAMFGVFLFLTYYLQAHQGIFGAAHRIRLPADEHRADHHLRRHRRTAAHEAAAADAAHTGYDARGRRHGLAVADLRRRRLRDAGPAGRDPARARIRPDLHAGLLGRDGRGRPAGRGRDLRDAQHLPAGRRIDRHGAAQHDRGVRDRELRLRAPPAAGRRRTRPGAATISKAVRLAEAQGQVHGYVVATWAAAGALVVAGIIGGLLIDKGPMSEENIREGVGGA